MKKIGEYTARGQVASRGVGRIILFDGRFDTGYRLVSVKVLQSLPGSTNADCYITLATEEAAADDEWDLTDQRQIGWAGSKSDPYPTLSDGIIDPDNFIVEDLWVYGNSVDNLPVNYLITMEKYDTTDWVGALAMVRNSAQDV
jgi:hypothetical protein